ncbi:hypothetical protein FJZ31_11720 [Candidatus Poribacteria bacterium]|nr:hypothetical protein [Candidatus Poribacteria bacterium]
MIENKDLMTITEASKWATSFLKKNVTTSNIPVIAEHSGMRIVNQYKRPVLNRTEKDKAAYSESIFHLKSE